MGLNFRGRHEKGTGKNCIFRSETGSGFGVLTGPHTPPNVLMSTPVGEVLVGEGWGVLCQQCSSNGLGTG